MDGYLPLSSLMGVSVTDSYEPGDTPCGGPGTPWEGQHRGVTSRAPFGRCAIGAHLTDGPVSDRVTKMRGAWRG